MDEIIWGKKHASVGRLWGYNDSMTENNDKS
jgi:hypothetical protein